MEYHADTTSSSAPSDDSSTSSPAPKTCPSDNCSSSLRSQHPSDGITFQWQKICMSTDEKEILSNVSGTAYPGKLTAIMGHSGCGKSMLVNVLSGRLRASKSLHVQHDIRRNGNPINPFKQQDVRSKIAFVAQSDDTLHSISTPRESIRFSARLRLQQGTPDAEIERIVTCTLKEMRLEDVADTFIRNISGGEARRTSLGIELVANPNLVILDEITSGLDSYNALSVVEVLRRLVARGTNVVFTVHQPSSQIFKLIDHLILMKQGHTVYNGSTHELLKYFAERGQNIPEHFSPADWIVQVCEYFDTYEDMESHGFGNGFVKAYSIEDDDFIDDNKDAKNQTVDLSTGAGKGPRIGLNVGGQIRLLLARGITNMIREKRFLILRYLLVAICGSLAAFAFAGVGDNDDLSSRASAIFFIVFACSQSFQVVLLEFIDEYPIVLREISTGHYTLFSYTITRAAFDFFNSGAQTMLFLLIIYWAVGLEGNFFTYYGVLFSFANICNAIGITLGSSSSDPRKAKELIPLTLLPQLLFSGFFVSVYSLPSWLPYLMPLTYALRIAISEELKSCLEYENPNNKYRDDCANFIIEQQKKGSPDVLSHALGNESTLVVAQVGLYTGKENIAEYLTLFSPEREHSSAIVVDFCGEEGTLLKLNEAGPGYCDITLAAIYAFKYNPIFTSYSDSVDQFQRTIIGQRLNATFPPGDLSADKLELDIRVLLSPSFFKSYFDVANGTNMSEFVCETMENFCPNEFAFNEFGSREECVGAMNSLPTSNINNHGLITADANSTGCRIVHANLARMKDPIQHCPHISFKPKADPNGKIKCSESNNIDNGELFTQSDMNLFERRSIEYGLDPLTFFQEGAKEAKCHADDAVKISPNRSNLDLSVSPNFLCRSYLESQDATGKYNRLYWSMLWILIVALRVLSYYLLRGKVKKLS